MSIRVTLSGLKSHIWSRVQTGEDVGGVSSRYSYSVWMRHLVLASEGGLGVPPRAIAELGPGGSLGVGIAALLSGASSYHALDAVSYTSVERNLNVLPELLRLYERQTAIPDATEFPEILPRLACYDFPSDILSGAKLAEYLRPPRVEAIKSALLQPGRVFSVDGEEISIRYSAPWNSPEVVEEDSMDLILSQATMEHVDDLPGTYAALRQWVRAGGFMTHQVDFRCHHTANEWNGHWKYSDFHWRIIKGNRTYLLNREPYSSHLRYGAENGFELVRSILEPASGGIGRSRLAKRFQHLTNEDLVTCGAFIVSKIGAKKS